MSRRWQNKARAKELLEAADYPVRGQPEITDKERREKIVLALEEMQKAGIVLKGPTVLDPVDPTKEMPLAYDVMFDHVENKAKPTELTDIANSLLVLHEKDLQDEKGGRRKTRKHRRHGKKKSLRRHK